VRNVLAATAEKNNKKPSCR